MPKPVEDVRILHLKDFVLTLPIDPAVAVARNGVCRNCKARQVTNLVAAPRTLSIAPTGSTYFFFFCCAPCATYGYRDAVAQYQLIVGFDTLTSHEVSVRQCFRAIQVSTKGLEHA